MQSIKNNSTEQEARFDIHELFFSITDNQSTIVSGNETFVRISGYAKDELVGQFHNIVRHQDMPRTVFKTFWDYLRADKPIVAYVKNRTKNGGYYWVIAAVFPLEDRYVSIRFKPSSALFTSIKEIYFRLLMAESKLEMPQSEMLLSELLNKLGYTDYNHFMNQALLTELLERKKLIQLNTSCIKEVDFDVSEFSLSMKSIFSSSKTLLNQYGKWFEKIDAFNKIKSMFEEKSLTLNYLARDIVLLSLNASISSYKLKDDGGKTFSVLASDIRTNSKENDILIGNIYNLSQSLSEFLRETIFIVSSISLQMEMITFFIQEQVENKTKIYTKELSKNIQTLFELVKTNHEKLTELPLSMNKSIKKTTSCLGELEQQIMYLGYIQVYGIIESARYNDDSQGFGKIFLQLKDLIVKTTQEISLVNSMSENFYIENSKLVENSKEITEMLIKLEIKIGSI
ncbi:MAG: PAS domain-containing protein [Campylobacterota bacterium]